MSIASLQAALATERAYHDLFTIPLLQAHIKGLRDLKRLLYARQTGIQASLYDSQSQLNEYSIEFRKGMLNELKNALDYIHEIELRIEKIKQ